MSEPIKLLSPYKLKKDPCRELCFDVSISDYDEIRFRLPRHGALDAILSNLFFQFVSQIKHKIPLPTSAEQASINEQLFCQAISTLDFTLTNGN